MSASQVLLCPVCGKSGGLGRFSIDNTGNAAQDRKEYMPKIAMRAQNPKNGQMVWTHYHVPLRILVALRQQMVEAVERVDAMIAEASQG